jgi:predicted HicB family RNase H-like nuclease
LKGVDDMTVSQKQLGYAKKYLSTLDEIRIRIPKGKKEEYRSAAEASGKSLNQFIIDCIEANLQTKG